MIKREIEVDVCLSPSELAVEFAEMCDNDQVAFFNALACEVGKRDVSFAFQLSYISKHEGLTDAVRSLMRMIGEYADRHGSVGSPVAPVETAVSENTDNTDNSDIHNNVKTSAVGDKSKSTDDCIVNVGTLGTLGTLDRIDVRWRCKHCGNKHNLSWPRLDFEHCTVKMNCDVCGRWTAFEVSPDGTVKWI